MWYLTVTDAQILEKNIGSGTGLVPSEKKSLPEPMLPHICVAIWHH